MEERTLSGAMDRTLSRMQADAEATRKYTAASENSPSLHERRLAGDVIQLVGQLRRVLGDGDWCDVCNAPQWAAADGSHECATVPQLRATIQELDRWITEQRSVLDFVVREAPPEFAVRVWRRIRGLEVTPYQTVREREAYSLIERLVYWLDHHAQTGLARGDINPVLADAQAYLDKRRG